MADAPNEKIQIDIVVNDNDAKTKLAGVTQSVTALSQAAGGGNFGNLKGIADGLKAITDSTKNLTAASNRIQAMSSSVGSLMSSFKSAGGFSAGDFTKFTKAVSGMSKGMSGVDTKVFTAVGRFAQGLKSLTNLAKDPALAQNLANIAQNVAKFAQQLSASISDEVLSRIERLGNALAGISSAKGFSAGGAGGIKGLGKGAEVVIGTFKTLGKEIKTATKLGMKLAQLPIRTLITPMKGVGNAVKSIGDRFTGLLQKIGRVAMTRAIRALVKAIASAFKEGTKAVYEWAATTGNSFQKTMDSIATSFTYLRNSIGAMVSPLLDAVAPAIDYIIDRCVDVLNVFNQLIATLTGATTWRKAEKVATSYGDAASNAASGTNDANKAAKELRRTLLGFDEINRLDAPDTSSGSGSSGGGSGSGKSGSTGLEFSEQQITSSVRNMADKLKEAWANADFTSIGSAIGLKIGTALQNVPWGEKIRPAVERLAKSFGTFLNGLLDYNSEGGKALWDGIAVTVYESLNTAILGYVTFFKTVNWKGIGEGIGAALKKVIENINWDGLADAFAAFPNAVIMAAQGLMKQMTPQDFYDAGSKVGECISKAIMRIKWKELFDDITGMGERLLNALNGALEAFDWTGIRNGILAGIKAVPPERWKNLGSQIGRAIVNLGDFLAQLVSTIVTLIKGADWEGIIKGIWDGINQKVTEKYGGWAGAAGKLAGWIGDNLDVLSIAFNFALGATVLKFTASAIKTAILSSSLLSSTGTLGGFLGGLPVMLSLGVSLAGLAYLKNKWGTKGLLQGLGAGIAGAIIGFTFLGPVGAALGFAVGVVLTLAIKSIAYDWTHATQEHAAAALAGNPIDPHDTELFFDPYEGMPDSWKNGENSTTRGMGGNNTKNRPHQRVATQGTGTAAVQKGQMISLTGEVTNIKYNKLSNTQKTLFGMFGSIGSVIQKKLNLKKNPVTGLIGWIQTAQDKIKKKGLAGFIAELTQKDDSKMPKIIQGMTALFKGHKKGTTWSDIVEGLTAKFRKSDSSGISTVSGLTAEFTGKKVSFDKLISGMTAGLSSKKITFDTLISSMTAGITKKDTSKAPKSFWTIEGFTATINKVKDAAGKIMKLVFGANGGIYKNGSWHNIQNYASGGYPSSGQMFIARERGPELVGTLAGSTAVMNNDQIVASVSAGVARAVAATLANGNQNPTIELTIMADSEVIYRTVRKGEKKANGRYATAVALG